MSVFNCEIELRWGDCDQLGHINNVYYLEYAQEARLRYFSKWRAEGTRLGPVVVRRVEVEYERPLLYSAAIINVELSVTKVGRTSFGMRQRILDRDGNLYAHMDFVLVVVDGDTGAAREIPGEARNLLEENLVAV